MMVRPAKAGDNAGNGRGRNLMKTLLIVIALFGWAAQGWALNMSGFKEAPITRLSGGELKAFRAFVMSTLDQTPDGVTVVWQAPKTRFVSKITPQRTFIDGKRKCREATVESEAHDRYQRGVYSFCQSANGEWQFKTPAARSGKK